MRNQELGGGIHNEFMQMREERIIDGRWDSKGLLMALAVMKVKGVIPGCFDAPVVATLHHCVKALHCNCG